MKKILSRLVLHGVLAPLATLVYQKYRPVVVAITGSVGKTTTREAVYHVLAPYFDAQKAMGSGNADWSVVATLLNPGYTPFTKNEKGWGIMLPHHIIWCWLVGIARFFLPLKYPRIFVLELGVDTPGDMKFFNRLMKYDIAVVTRVGQAHMEFFQDYDALFAEKTAIYAGLKSTGLAIGNADQADLARFIHNLVARHQLVGTASNSDIRVGASQIVENKIRANYVYSNQPVVIDLPFGRQWLPAAAIAIAVGREFGLTIEQIRTALSGLEEIHGRFEVYELKRGIRLIDDSYNANLDSMRLALDSLDDLKASKRIAVLGDMKELGALSDVFHREVGEYAARRVDWLFTVGESGRLIANGALLAGMDKAKVVSVADLTDDKEVTRLVDAIWKKIGDNDAVLIKASRAMNLKRVVKTIIQRLS